MKIIENIIIYIRSFFSWITWWASKIDFKQYFSDIHNPNTKTYDNHAKVLKILTIVSLFLTLWAFIFHLIN